MIYIDGFFFQNHAFSPYNIKMFEFESISLAGTIIYVYMFVLLCKCQDFAGVEVLS